MKGLISVGIISGTILLANFIFANPSDGEQPAQEVPAYAKWGGIAMQKTKEKYPHAKIIDYLHVGREVGTTTSTEKFKLWLKEGDREFGVFIDIQFDQKTEGIMNISFKETAR